MQNELFGTPPHKLHRKDDPQTSVDAANEVDTTNLEGLVYSAIESFGQDGCISDQVRGFCQTHFDIQSYSSVTARYKALEEKGLIEVLEETRSGISGKQQRIMRIPGGQITCPRCKGKGKCDPPTKRGPQFKPPTVEEVLAYLDERVNAKPFGFATKVDAVAFVDFYQSKGWMVGKTKMKDWKAAVRTWEKRQGETILERKKREAAQ